MLILTTTVVGGAVAASAYFWLRHKARQDFVPVARLANIVIHPIKSIVGVEVPYADCTVAGPVYKGLKDRVRKFDYNAVEVSEEASQWFRNYLKCDDVRLVRVLLDQKTINRGCTGAAPVAFQDESAFHVISKASLEKLQSKLPPEADVRRRNFRPSLFVEGCDAHSEDHWLRYKIGEAEMAFLERTTRCVMTTVNQGAGIKTNKEPLVTLRKYRVDRSELGLKKYQSKPLLGIGSIHVKDGRIAVGDEVYAVLSPTPLL
ncbi:mitochondrial amidoxime-reducing component 1-like isoform X4 [Haemaphysalis longicornis]